MSILRLLALTTLVFAASCGRGGYDARGLGIPSDARPVCRSSDILGVRIGEVDGGSGSSCGISNAVRVYAVSGVVLSQPADLNCDTARTLNDWVRRQARPTISGLRARLVSLKVAASYACRTRNSVPGGRISEHAKGNAIDISGFGLSDGTTLSVLNDWNSWRRGRILRRLHGSACGRFGTVLGPESDRHHRDHFHFDTADQRNGPYCR